MYLGERTISERLSEQLPMNEKIRSKELLLIDDEGNNLGTISTSTALSMAKEKDLDLVVISPNQDPPVAKILDYGKYKFQSEKKAKEAKKKQHVVSLKELKLRYKIDLHDYNVRIKSIKKFIEAGNKVKVVIMLRGREVQHAHLAMGLMERILTDLEDFPMAVEKKPSREGNNVLMILAP
ncbi:MAG: translation initiation factor IF-3 [Candidatus Gastranaerophilales bacterium]|nr:translation initiation factor IF-3 [Candidatus Gastranaerophilales bacterium]